MTIIVVFVGMFVFDCIVVVVVVVVLLKWEFKM